MQHGHVVVVGGANVDIGGTASTAILSGDSNPGLVSDSPGGVGRNIAENLVHLGAKVHLVTALGGDIMADRIRSSCTALGIDLTHSVTLPKQRTGTYLYLSSPDGDLYAAVSDMQIYDQITPEMLIEPCLDLICSANLVIVDANMPQSILNYLAAHCTAPLAADPVSVKKAPKLLSILGSLLTIKPNRQEASALTGIPIHGIDGVPEAAEQLLKMGVKNVFISLGGHGVYYTDGQAAGIQPCCPAKIVNTSGCGDAFLSAASLSLVSGRSIADSALLGQAAAAICSEDEAAGTPAMHMDAVLRRAGIK